MSMIHAPQEHATYGEIPLCGRANWEDLIDNPLYVECWECMSILGKTRTAISSNGFSHDMQVADAWSFLREQMTDFDSLVQRFPEMERIVWDGSYFDTAAMGVDVEFSSWVCDALEETGLVIWEDGEPFGVTDS